MVPADEHRYLSTHPWVTFTFKMGRLMPRTWVLLGEAASKCEHLAGSPMPPGLAEELNRVSLERGAYGTTSIEGNSLSEEEVRAIVRGQSSIPPSRAYLQQEIENLLVLFNDIARDCLEDPPLLSPDRLKKQHARLLVGQPEKADVVPGEFRTHDVVVNRYRGAPPEDCAYLVDRLCGWLNDELGALDGSDEVLRVPQALVLAILAHLYLAWIHPFGDGNGRIARLLEFEILLRAGIPIPAAHLLSDHYNRTRNNYYAVLERASRDDNHPVEDFVHYAVEGLVDGLRGHIEMVRGMQLAIMWQSYVHEQFHGVRTSARTRMRDVVLALPPGEWTLPEDIVMLTKPINAAYQGKTSKTLSRDLNELERMGLVERRRGSGVRPRIERMAAFLPPRRGQ